MKYFVHYKYNDMEKFKSNQFESLEIAIKFIYDHPNFKKTYFNKKGLPSSKNPDQKSYFRITDNMGNMYYIK